jgi:hypothetical protein
MLKLATRRRVRTGLIGGYGTGAYLAARIALPHVGLLLQIGYAACSREIVYVRLANEIASNRTSTATLAAAGWLIGVPLGYLLDRLLVWMVKTVLNLNLTLAFPPWNLALTLAGTILLAPR